jgi:methionine--tRNA ligase beta chain
MITHNDFQKLDIRIGTIVSVERLIDTDKLLKFMIDIWSEQRQIIAGMAEFFSNLDQLVWKQIPILLNIEPRNFKWYVSHGMIIAADIWNYPVLLHPSREIPGGSIVR